MHRLTPAIAAASITDADYAAAYDAARAGKSGTTRGYHPRAYADAVSWQRHTLIICIRKAKR